MQPDDDLSAWRRWTAADFARRAEPAELPEWMDGPCSPAELRSCLRDLATVNRLTLSYRPTLRFLASALRASPGRELHVVDIGSGYGDMLRAVWHWARKRGVPLRLTGIDLHPATAEIARAATTGGELIEWRTGDALTDPAVQDADLVISSLVMHHLSRAEIVQLLRWMEARARIGWFANDLERARRPARAFALLSRLMGWHRFVQHDGPVSFRRAFRTHEWQAMLREAKVPTGAARVSQTFPARLCVERLR